MLTKPDAQQLQALARISRSSDGEVLKAFLETELDRLTTNLLDSSGEVTPKVQGMARQVKDLIVLLKQAPELAEKTR